MNESYNTQVILSKNLEIFLAYLILPLSHVCVTIELFRI